MTVDTRPKTADRGRVTDDRGEGWSVGYFSRLGSQNSLSYRGQA